MDVLELFGTTASDIQRAEAANALAQAIRNLDLSVADPDLIPVALAVQEVLSAWGFETEALKTKDWSDFEIQRFKQRIEDAWLRCDALYRLDREAAKQGGWRHLGDSVLDTSQVPLIPPKED